MAKPFKADEADSEICLEVDGVYVPWSELDARDVGELRRWKVRQWIYGTIGYCIAAFLVAYFLVETGLVRPGEHPAAAKPATAVPSQFELRRQLR